MHVRYGWIGTVVEGPQAHVVDDASARVEVRWNGVGDRPYITPTADIIVWPA